jgi:hypothetical protein
MQIFGDEFLVEEIAVLQTGEEILAKAKRKRRQGSNPDWVFYLGAKPFALRSVADGHDLPSVPISEGFRISDMSYTDKTVKLEITTYYASHHGSVLDIWRINFNTEDITASVEHIQHIDTNS